MQDLMCSAPFNPVVKKAIEVAWEMRRAVPRVDGIASFRDHMTMVNSWTTGIELALFGRADVNMMLAREAIYKVPQLLTYKEEWCDGLFVRPYPDCKNLSRAFLYES